MKKIILSLLLLFCLLNGKAQSLLNTTWLGTNPPNPNLWFQFRTDTLFYSFGSGGYTALSLYTASGGVFSIFDLPGTSMCTDTGHYNYTIVGNILTFTLISENCVSRRNTMVDYHWLMLSTGVAEYLPESVIRVYPNPAPDGIFTISLTNFVPGNQEVLIYDLSGKLVLQEKINAAETCLDIGYLPHGIYLGMLRSEKGTSPFKIVK